MNNWYSKSALLSFCILYSLFLNDAAAQPRILAVLPANFGANTHFNLDNLMEYGYSITLAGVTRQVTSCPWSAAMGSQTFTVDTLLGEIQSADSWDAIVIMPSEWRTSANPCSDLIGCGPFMNLLREANTKSKLIWATCAGVRVLAAADIIRGLSVTGQTPFAQECINAGATFVGTSVPPVWDRNIITSSRGMYYMQENIEILSTAFEKSRVTFNRFTDQPALIDVSTGELDIALWDHHYTSEATTGLRSVESTPDGGYISAGYTWAVPGHNSDLLLTRSDKSGNLIWSKTFGDQGWEYGWSVIATRDGGYAAAGYSSSTRGGDKNMYLVKTDGSGNLLWDRLIGGSGLNVARNVIELIDGSLLLTGYTDQTAGGEYDIQVIRIDGSGEHVWTRTYGGAGPEIARSAIQNRKGNLIIAGETGSTSNGNRDMLLICLDTDGNRIWEKTYHKNNYDSGYDVAEMSSGGYCLIGHGDIHGTDFLEMAVVKTDSLGNCLSHDLLEATTRFYDYGKSVAMANNGTIAYLGVAKKKTTRENKLFLIMLDPDGRTLMENWFDLNGSSWCTSLIACQDNHFAIAGQDTEDNKVYRSRLLKITNPAASGIPESRNSDSGLLNCYPNPFRHQITIQPGRIHGKQVSISVLDMTGNLIDCWTAETSGNPTIIWTGRSGQGKQVPPGFYIISCKSSGYCSCQKVLYLQ